VKTKPIPKNHSLRRYLLSLDEDGVLLAATRIRQRQDPSQPRKLIVLSLHSELTRRLIRSLHSRYLHPGTQNLLSIINQTFLITGLKNHLKGLSRACPTCQRVYDQGVQQPMGLLPVDRTSPAPPFSKVGVDYAGPFLTKRGHTRKPVTIKSYACLFVCLATRAVHLELCLDLTTEEFMAALRRFCARRGLPSHVYSDNGTNFVGAHREFNHIRELLKASRDKILHFSQENEVEWSFIPPRTPHMGGLWEAGVKQMKRLMLKHLQPHTLRTDELASILIEIEAILNSRPLTPLESTDPDVTTLTPGHFLIGRPLTAACSRSYDSSIGNLKRWQLTQRLSQDLWHNWKTHYIQSIQARNKHRHTHTLQKGDVVFLKDDSLAYRQWPLAKVLEVHEGDDGVVRVVDVLCQGKKLRRATIHLIPFGKEHGPPTLPPQYVQVQQTTEQEDSSGAGYHIHSLTNPCVLAHSDFLLSCTLLYVYFVDKFKSQTLKDSLGRLPLLVVRKTAIASVTAVARILITRPLGLIFLVLRTL